MDRLAMDELMEGASAPRLRTALAQLRKYRLVVEHTSNMVVITDAQRRIAYVNPAYTQVTGWTLNEVRGHKPGRFVQGPQTSSETVRRISQALSRGEPICGIELINYKRDGQAYWVQLNIQPVRDGAGQVTHFVAIQADVTAQRLARDALVASERRLAEAHRLARLASFECNLASDEVVWTVGADVVLGLERTRLPAHSRAHLALVHEEDQPAWSEAQARMRQAQTPYEVEYRLASEPVQAGAPERALRWVRERGYFLPATGRLPERLCGLVYDISATKVAQDRIEYLAWHDTLTGLVNREHLQTVLCQRLEAARLAGQQLAVMFIDLDRFKAINDTLGHHVGDAVLRTCADRLRESVRSSDVVGRLGGDEFLVVVSDIDDAGVVARIGGNLLSRLAAPMRVHERELHVTPSIGVSLYPQDGESASELMRHADAAMYQAKGLGRNTLSFFSHEINARAAARFELEGRLRLAVSRQELSLHFQPQFRVGSKRPEAFEALLRWQTPEGHWIAPDAFIPVAEESGLIHTIGHWVLEQACGQWLRWQALSVQPVRVAINLSAHQLRDPSLVDRIAAAMARVAMPPQALEVELTESVAMHDPAASIELMKRLRTLGVLLTVDDFGTGYSSLAYLKTLPVQRLKLDRSFVKDIEHDPDDKAICAASIQMAHALGLEVVAEGVETEAQGAYLSACGCDLLQGYHLGRPVPPEDIDALLREAAST